MTITSNDKCQISLVYTSKYGCRATVIQLVPSDIRTYSPAIAWLVANTAGHGAIIGGKVQMPRERSKLNITGPTLVVARTVRCMLEIVMAARYGLALRDVNCISSRGW